MKNLYINNFGSKLENEENLQYPNPILIYGILQTVTVMSNYPKINNVLTLFTLVLVNSLIQPHENLGGKRDLYQHWLWFHWLYDWCYTSHTQICK